MQWITEERVEQEARTMWDYLFIRRLMSDKARDQIEVSCALAEYHEALGEERSA